MNKGPGPNSLALIVIYLKADFLIGGVPFLIFKSNIIIFRFFYSSKERSLSSSEFKSAPKYPISSGLILGMALGPSLGVPGISIDFPYSYKGILYCVGVSY